MRKISIGFKLTTGMGIRLFVEVGNPGNDVYTICDAKQLWELSWRMSTQKMKAPVNCNT